MMESSDIRTVVEVVGGVAIALMQAWTIKMNRAARCHTDNIVLTVADIKKDVNSAHTAAIARGDDLQAKVIELTKTVATLQEKIVGMHKAAVVLAAKP